MRNWRIRKKDFPNRVTTDCYLITNVLLGTKVDSLSGFIIDQYPHVYPIFGEKLSL
jgi:hypothetical protein